MALLFVYEVHARGHDDHFLHLQTSSKSIGSQWFLLFLCQSPERSHDGQTTLFLTAVLVYTDVMCLYIRKFHAVVQASHQWVMFTDKHNRVDDVTHNEMNSVTETMHVDDIPSAFLREQFL